MNSRAASGARMASVALVIAAMTLVVPLAARAADLQAVNRAAQATGVASAVGAGSAVPALGFGALLQTVLGLALVLGLVFGCAWLARRLGVQGARSGSLVKTVGGASLGGKERVAVVEVGDTWLVLGAAPGNVRLLHAMPAGTLPEAATATAAAAGGGALQGSFGQRFRDALKGEVGKRFSRHHDGAQ